MPTTTPNKAQQKPIVAEERLREELKDIPVSFYVRIVFSEFSEDEKNNTIAYLEFLLKRA